MFIQNHNDVAENQTVGVWRESVYVCIWVTQMISHFDHEKWLNLDKEKKKIIYIVLASS